MVSFDEIFFIGLFWIKIKFRMDVNFLKFPILNNVWNWINFNSSNYSCSNITVHQIFMYLYLLMWQGDNLEWDDQGHKWRHQFRQVRGLSLPLWEWGGKGKSVYGHWGYNIKFPSQVLFLMHNFKTGLKWNFKILYCIHSHKVHI